MGKIRMAAKAKEPIPPSWAVKADGSPTTNAEEAIKGMLLPSAGPKGFGLSFMIDMLCGLLSSGAHGDGVKPLYGSPDVPYDCSLLFMAIDVPHFRELRGFKDEAERAAVRIRNAKRAPGVSRLFTPGEPEWARRAYANGMVVLDPAVIAMLKREAQGLGLGAALLEDGYEKDREQRHAQT
jgi:LDH2 family malate/lactate/ureidoglycolate dehydrogenase